MTQALATERFVLTTASYYPEKSEMLAKIRFTVSFRLASGFRRSSFCV